MKTDDPGVDRDDDDDDFGADNNVSGVDDDDDKEDSGVENNDNEDLRC